MAKQTPHVPKALGCVSLLQHAAKIPVGKKKIPTWYADGVNELQQTHSESYHG